MPAASALPPVIASERCVPGVDQPSSSRTWASRNRVALAGVARRSATAAGSWISMSGQPAAASAAMVDARNGSTEPPRADARGERPGR